MTKLVVLEKDQYLIHEGDESKSMFWLQKGQLVVTKKKGQEEVVLGHINAGELVGEISFLDKEARSASVKAITVAELIEIPSENYDKIFEGQPKWFKILVTTLCERLRKANQRIKV